jgi:flagella basal body P-ring formation protein FlgA
MTMRFLITASVLLTLPASAATLRPMTTLAAPVVLLSDLFDDAGANAGQVLGPGPAPGGRIVVEAPQLAAIARQFGVAWKPVSKGDRAVLERPGKPLPRDAVMEVLRDALVNAGMNVDSEIEVPALAMPMIPFESDLQPVVTQLNLDPESGIFSATLTLGGKQMAVAHIRASGRVHETVAVLVPVRRIQRGEVLRPSDLREQRLRAAQVNADVARLPSDAVGMTPRTALMADRPMRLAELVRPPAVEKGATVQMLLNGGGMALVAQAQALEAGAPGEHVRVLNPSSRAVVEATVIGPGQVRVSPDNLPMRPTAYGAVAQAVVR